MEIERENKSTSEIVIKNELEKKQLSAMTQLIAKLLLFFS